MNDNDDDAYDGDDAYDDVNDNADQNDEDEKRQWHGMIYSEKEFCSNEAKQGSGSKNINKTYSLRG